MVETALLQNYVIVGAILLQGVSISLVAWSRFHSDWGGQILVIFILTVAACEAAILMALVMMLFQRTGSLDIAIWQSLREENQPAFVETDEQPRVEEEYRWPHLVPAGVEPEHDPEETAYRSHV